MSCLMCLDDHFESEQVVLRMIWLNLLHEDGLGIIIIITIIYFCWNVLFSY